MNESKKQTETTGESTMKETENDELGTTHSERDEPRREEAAAQPEEGSWDEFRATFRGLGNLKDARKLRDLRDRAREKIPELRSEIKALRREKEQADTPLDALAIQEESDELESRIAYCEDKLDAVNRRVENILQEAQGKQEADGASSAEADRDQHTS